MCFYADPEWHADITETEDGPAPEPFRCDECRQDFPAGAWREYVYMQQHEECQSCDPDENDCGCQCDEPCYGETFEYHCCRTCRLLVQAIRAVELERGCRESESRPPLSGLFEDLSQIDRADRDTYVARAREMFPELVTHRWDFEEDD